MKETNLAGIDLQDIQIFLLAAEMLNFSAVGRTLYLSQSTISKSIARLENSTELVLFVKQNGKVRLTPAGRELQKNLSGFLNQIETALTEAHRVQACLEDRLRIGFPNPSDSPQVLHYVQLVQQAFPQCQISVEVHGFSTLRTKLLNGDLDAIFTVLFEADSLNNTDIGWKLLQALPLCVFIPPQHPLAKKDTVTVADLKNEKFIVHSPSMVPGYIKLINDTCASHGFTPIISKYTENIGSFVLALLMGEGILVGDNLMAANFPPDVRCYPLEGTSSGKILAWNQTNLSKSLRYFVRICTEQNL